MQNASKAIECLRPPLIPLKGGGRRTPLVPPVEEREVSLKGDLEGPGDLEGQFSQKGHHPQVFC